MIKRMQITLFGTKNDDISRKNDMKYIKFRSTSLEELWCQIMEMLMFYLPMMIQLMKYGLKDDRNDRWVDTADGRCTT